MLKKSRLNYITSLVVLVSVVASSFLGILNLETNEVIADTDPETGGQSDVYTATAGYSTLINIEGPDGTTYRGYCINSNRSSWTAGNTFTEIQGSLQGYTTNYNDQLAEHLERVLYFGYPYDAAGIKEDYSLTDSEFRSLTQTAVWKYTNYSSTYQYSGSYQAAFTRLIELVEASEPAVENCEIRFLTTGNSSKQNAAILVLTVPQTITISKVDGRNPDEGTMPLLAGVTFELSSVGSNSLADVSVVQGENTAGNYNAATNTITFTTVGDCNTVLQDIRTGRYMLTETAVPEDFGASTFFFQVMGDGSVVNIDRRGQIVASNYATAEGSTYTAINGTPTPAPVSASVSFVKTNDRGEYPSGAVFELRPLYDLNNTVPDVALTGMSIEGASSVSLSDYSAVFTTAGNTISFSNIYAGYYYLHELSAPEGHTLLEQDYYFRIDGDGNLYQLSSLTDDVGTQVDDKTIEIINNVIVTPTPPVVSIGKCDNMGDYLGGASFTITPKEGHVIDLSGVLVDFAVNSTYNASDNSITISADACPFALYNLPFGIYIINEVIAPEGYERNEQGWELTVSYQQNSSTEEYSVNTSVTDLSYNYTYQLNPLRLINYISQTEQTYSISIEKVDNLGGYLEGAVLQLVRDSGSVPRDVAVTQNGDEITATSITRGIQFTTVDGSTVISGLTAGDYTLSEVTSPEGYQRASDIHFNIGTEQTQDSSGNTETVGLLTVDNERTEGWTITMTDLPETSGFRISKQDIGGNELPGAVLTITNTDGQEIDLSGVTATVSDGSAAPSTASGFSASVAEVRFTSGNLPTEISNLPAGTYYLTEQTAPEGFDSAERIEFIINEEGVISRTDGTGVSDNVLVMTDAPIVHDFWFFKKDSVTGEDILGAEFTLSNAPGTHTNFENVNIPAQYYGNPVKSRSSVVFYSGMGGVYISQIPAGTYVLRETHVPSGYSNSDRQDSAPAVTFTIRNDGSITDISGDYIALSDYEGVPVITMENTPAANLFMNFNKYNEDGTALLGGARFILGSLGDLEGGIDPAYRRLLNQVTVTGISEEAAYDESSNTITFATLAASPTIFRNLYPGYYYLQELEAPSGYLRNEFLIRFYIDANNMIYYLNDNNMLVMPAYQFGTGPADLVMQNFPSDEPEPSPSLSPSPSPEATPTPTATPVPMSTPVPTTTPEATPTPSSVVLNNNRVNESAVVAQAQPEETPTSVPTEMPTPTPVPTDTEIDRDNDVAGANLSTTGEDINPVLISGFVMIILAGILLYIQIRLRKISDLGRDKYRIRKPNL